MTMTILGSLKIVKLEISNGVPYAFSSLSALMDLKELRVGETIMTRKAWVPCIDDEHKGRKTARVNDPFGNCPHRIGGKLSGRRVGPMIFGVKQTKRVWESRFLNDRLYERKLGYSDDIVRQVSVWQTIKVVLQELETEKMCGRHA